MKFDGLILSEPLPPMAGYGRGTGCCSGKRVSGFGSFGLARGLAGFGSFAGVPTDIRSYILSQVPQNPGETDGLLNNPDGVHVIHDFDGIWSNLVAIGNDLATIRNEAEAATAVQREAAIAQSINDALIRARQGYPWGAAFNRSGSQQAILDAALGALGAAMGRYATEVAALTAEAKVAIKARQTAEAERAKQEALKQAAQAQAAGNVAQAQAAQAAAQAAEAKKTQLVAELEFAKLAKEASTLKIFGLPAVAVVPAGAAALGVIGLITYSLLKKKR